MNEYEAQRQGYNYCGPTFSRYSRYDSEEHWKENLAFAKKIKKEYEGADYVIVTGTKNSWLSQDSKGLYGNETFNKVWHLTRYNNVMDQREIFSRAKQNAKEEYEAKIKEIEAKEQKYNEQMIFLESIRKVK